VGNTGWEGQSVEHFHIRTSEGGSPHLSWLRTNRLALVRKFDYVLAHTRFMGSHELSSFDGHRVGRYLTTPRRGIMWKMCIRER
jgi:hypothetical protein